jgi:hypothetical protein
MESTPMRIASKSALLVLLPLIALVAMPVQAQFLINEVDADTAGTDVLEFIEIYDGGIGGLSLAGHCIVFYNGSSDTSYFAMDLTGSTDAAGYYLIGNTLLVPAPAQTWADNLLQNGADAVALYLGSAASFPNGTAVTLAGLVDAVVYDTSDVDDAGLLVLTPGASGPQIDENANALSASESIARCPNGSGGPLVTTTFRATPPSPGAANTCPTFAISVSQLGGCGFPVTFSVTGAMPFVELFNIVSLACVTPGTGPLFGLSIGPGSGDPIVQFLLPVGTVPFHVTADGLGNYSVTFPVPPCTPVVSLTVQAVCLQLVPGSFTVLGISQNTTCTAISW